MFGSLGKKCNYVVCKVCNSRSAQLYKLYGKWPPVQFKALSPTDQNEFYKSIMSMTGNKQLKMYTDTTLKITRIIRTEDLPMTLGTYGHHIL